MNQATGSSRARRLPVWISSLAAGICAAMFFYLIRNLRIPGGDTLVVLGKETFGLLWSGSRIVFDPRQMGCHILAKLFFGYTQDLHAAFTGFCCLSAAVYFALLAGFCRRPLFWLIMLFSALTWNFAGHIEYYAPLMATLLLFFITLSRALEPEPRAKPVHVALTFALSFLFHKLTLFFLPATLWLFFTRRGGRWQRREVGPRQAEWFLVIIIIMVLLDVLPGVICENWNYLNAYTLYIPTSEHMSDFLTPLTPGIARYFESKSITGMFYVYTFGTPKHFAYFFGFLLTGAPLGVPILLRYWRRIFQSEAALALATAALCGLIWTFMWQPRCFWRDWDLFCLAGMPINFLAGGLAVGMWRGEKGSEETDGLRPETRKERIFSIAGIVFYFGMMCVLGSIIHAGQIEPGKGISELVDLRPGAPIKGAQEIEQVAAQWHVTLDPKNIKAVYLFPNVGILKYLPHPGRIRIAGIGKDGKIATVQNGTP